jgi:hypothetical protein
MKSVVSRVVEGLPSHTITVEHIDVSMDPALERLYGEEIPVLLINDRKAAKYRISEGELRRRLGK